MRPSRLPDRIVKIAFLPFILIVMLLTTALPTFALDPVEVSRDDVAIDLTNSVEIHEGQGNAFQVSTVPDANGIRRRIEVRATDSNGPGDWAVFSLANISDEQLERVIVAPHFRLPDSGLFWPDLGSARIAAITPSEGFALTREKNAEADVFSITLNPGAVVTFVAELESPTLPQLYLWQPDAYKDTENAFTLYHGVVLGIAGLLAVFLTILFVVKGTSVLPATAMLAWSVLLYVAIDFGFLNMLIPLSAGDLRIWRASADVAIAFSLVVFLFTYLNLSRWHVHLGYGAAVWGVILMALFGVAIFDPPAAAGIARLSGALTVGAGIALILYLSFRRYDRAILLMPAWALISAWLFAAWMTVTGRIDNDIVQPALDGGLVLLVLLLGFTVIQHAFASGGYQTGLFSDLERQALALLGSDGVVWDWDVSRDRIITEPDFSPKLGLSGGTLNGPARSWLNYLHPGDRDRFRSTLDMFLEWKRGKLKLEFRIRASDGHYHWMLIKARPVLSTDGEVIRCVGSLTDMTDRKVSTQRLLQDAVIDNLTGLPNRTIFVDRLQSLIGLSAFAPALRPTLIIADIDRYADINNTLGFAAGDNILIALTRRIQRLLRPEDTLSRLSGNSFAIVLLSQTDPEDIAEFTEALASAIAVPVSFDNREIVLTASIGIASWHDEQETADALIEDARLAMHRVKRAGGGSVETYRPSFRMLLDEREQVQADLTRAIDRKEMSVLYRPVIRVNGLSITGFQCMLNWKHPQRGEISSAEIFEMSEENGTAPELVLYTVRQAAKDLSVWQQAMPKAKPFVIIELACAEMLRTSTLIELENIVRQSEIAPRQIVFALPENVALEAPEQARLALQHLRSIGTGLSLTRFGDGHGSLTLLNRFHFDSAFIDISLFRQHQEEQAGLLQTFAALADKLGVDVGVSNVTTEADTTLLAQSGCTFATGPLYGTSADSTAVQRLLRDELGRDKG
ncbi:EAL domain-containing protein [Martelella mediterranea]|uniref:PAS domain S-box-containing protein/diguanylate cyclase (GGDEF)-like protein n=1 Tax=Martelella mediterranea TaxID=293089 RepID=A0A4R3NUT2_9HYPH|nr:EAL domain-containing protein [Martelella mediterranea]TCT37305.1 PAS domain S-box-containing protein/diguanylate cyclase (GGDEF)-like protein [Martelella mediterranea]